MTQPVSGIQTQQLPAVFTGVNIGGQGHSIAVNWNPVAGATKAEVSEAILTLKPSVVQELTNGAQFQKNGNGWIVTPPAKKRVRSLALTGFRYINKDLISGNSLNKDDTNKPGDQDKQITVAFPKLQGSGYESPRFVFPSLKPHGNTWETLAGADFSNRTLTLTPAVAANKVRIALVTGNNPLEFNELPTQLNSVNLTTHATAQNVEVAIDGGEAQWRMPEFDPDAPVVEVNLRAGLETLFNQKLSNQDAPKADIKIKADAPANIMFYFPAPRGFLVRTEPGILKASVEGSPVELPLTAPLAGEAPTMVTGDLTIRYSGIRILENATDPLPAPAGSFSGVIVGNEPAVHIFPPEALRGIEPARVGIFGRAAEDCEISLEFVKIAGDTVGSVLAPPAVLKLKQDNAMSMRWVSIPKGVQIDGAAGLRVRANRGRFFWVTPSGVNSNPIVRIAVNDPDPGGRELKIGSIKLANISEIESHTPAFKFPAAIFRGSTPTLDSSLFLSIEFSDLTMRYAR